MSAVTERRRALRSEARERQKATVPKLRAQVRARKVAKKKRIAKCRADCKRRRDRVQVDAVTARAQLRERIKQAKVTARAACGVCKVTATEKELDKLDRALGAVQVEREAIADLRRRASLMVDPRGRAGGRRAAELRSESDDEVRNNIGDDPDLAALWESIDRRKFQKTKYMSRTEAFLDHVHNHPEELDELRNRQQVQYDREAEEMLSRWPRDESIGKMSDVELAQLMTDLDQADQQLAAADAAAPF